MATPKELRNELLGKTLVENLEKRHFEAYYCPTAAEALEKAVSLIPEKSVGRLLSDQHKRYLRRWYHGQHRRHRQPCCCHLLRSQKRHRYLRHE